MSRIDELIERLCPDGVEYKAIDELGTLFSGLSGKTKADFGMGEGRFVTYKNIFDNPSVNLEIVEPVVVGTDERQNALAVGDVLFTGSSESPEEAGMSSVVMELPDHPLYMNSFCFGFRPNYEGLFDPGFLKHLFRDGAIRKQIIRTANGVTRFNISKKQFLKVRIPVPPMEVNRVCQSRS